MNKRALTLAFLFLALGASIYLFVRPAPVWFVPSSLHNPLLAHSSIGAILGSLPVLAHVLALSLLTATALGTHVRAAIVAPTFWALVNVAFEIGQHASVAPLLLRALPQRFEELWLLDQLRPYFANGTFDPLDIAGALAGALVARFLITNMNTEIRHAPA